jgi:hypothetical protein
LFLELPWIIGIKPSDDSALFSVYRVTKRTSLSKEIVAIFIFGRPPEIENVPTDEHSATVLRMDIPASPIEPRFGPSLDGG